MYLESSLLKAPVFIPNPVAFPHTTTAPSLTPSAAPRLEAGGRVQSFCALPWNVSNKGRVHNRSTPAGPSCGVFRNITNTSPVCSSCITHVVSSPAPPGRNAALLTTRFLTRGSLGKRTETHRTWTCDLQIVETVNLCYFKPLNLWSFIMTAIEIESIRCIYLL